MKLLFDSHLDLAWNALGWSRDLTRSVAEINRREAGMRNKGRGGATTSLPEMRRGGVAVCLATVLARARPEASSTEEPCRISLDYPNQQIACAAAQGQLAYYRLLEEQGEVRFLRTSDDLDAHWRQWETSRKRGVEGEEWRRESREEKGEGGKPRNTGSPHSPLTTHRSPPAAHHPPLPAHHGPRATGHWPVPAPHAPLAARPGVLPLGIILAMEGADPIVEPAQAEAWFRDGLRSASLTHYGKGPYGAGTGQSGRLTQAGVQLLGQFERLGILLDVTHLSEPGFSEALDRFAGPILASHNNCRALVPGGRQFSDGQIRRLVQRDAVIGVALDAWMLYPHWEIGRTQREVVTLEAVVDHVDHVCQLAGHCRHVGIGSDLDGGYGTEQVPVGLETIADLQKLAEILARRGYRDEDIDAVFHGNWLRFFARHLPASA